MCSSGFADGWSETGTVHIAQNYGVKTVCISNGSFMNTFQPYPKEESFVTYVYPDNIENYIRENNRQGQHINFDINTIDYKKVTDTISEVMNN